MNLLEARKLAKKRMQENRLFGWSFGFDRAKRRAGICDYAKRRIGLSRVYVQMYDIDDVEQTILHEIAHAIVGPRVGHGLKWKLIAMQIGVRNPKTKTEVNVEYCKYLAQSANYVLECPNCGIIAHGNRMGKRMRTGLYSCRKCRTRRLKWRSK